MLAFLHLQSKHKHELQDTAIQSNHFLRLPHLVNGFRHQADKVPEHVRVRQVRLRIALLRVDEVCSRVWLCVVCVWVSGCVVVAVSECVSECVCVCVRACV